MGGVNEGDAKRRQQQEYAAALEQQRHERAHKDAESRERRQGGGGDVFGGAKEGDAKRQQLLAFLNDARQLTTPAAGPLAGTLQIRVVIRLRRVFRHREPGRRSVIGRRLFPATRRLVN